MTVDQLIDLLQQQDGRAWVCIGIGGASVPIMETEEAVITSDNPHGVLLLRVDKL